MKMVMLQYEVMVSFYRVDVSILFNLLIFVDFY